MNNVNEEAFSAPKPQVGLCSHDFRLACLNAMPYFARLELLGDAKTLRQEPGWIGASIAIGLFKIDEAPAASSGRDRLVRGEHPGIARVVESLLSREGVPPSARTEHDPANGDLLSGAMASMNPPEMSVPMTVMFAALVDHVIAQLTPPADGAAPAQVTSRALAKKPDARPQVPTDSFSVNLALLLTVACATGDVERAKAISLACPAAMHVPVSDAWLGSVYISKDLYMPPLAAAACNRVAVLEALKVCGWDPLGPLMVSAHASKASRDLTDPNAKGRKFSDFLMMADHGASIIDGVWPRTAELFLKEASLRFQAPGTSDGAIPLNAEQCKRFIGVARGAISGSDHKEWLSALGRAGVFERHADNLVHAAVERVNAIWRKPGAIHTDSSRASQIDFLDRFLNRIDWTLHRGTGFLVDWALERGSGGSSLALHLAQKCVQSGHTDLITAPHEVHDPGALDFNPLHKWAAQGRTDLVVFAMAQGADPLKLWFGVTPIGAAEAQGHADTANAIRSVVARRAAQDAIEAMGLDGADPHSEPRPAGRRAP